jgi:hypothetical protein
MVLQQEKTERRVLQQETASSFELGSQMDTEVHAASTPH